MANQLPKTVTPDVFVAPYNSDVHRLDAAVLLRLALEKGTARATYDAVAEQGVPINMSGLFHAVCSENPTSSELGWHPTQPELLVDVEADYFSKYSTWRRMLSCTGVNDIDHRRLKPNLSNVFHIYLY